MPTPVSSARQCLASDSASALDAAVAAARRRAHAQTTSLHVIFALLSSSSPSPSPSLLRDALARARSSAFSQRLQFKALDLCFSVALDRLPSSSSSDCDEPPISNSLMAAIKRSQANQRRHPDTFHLYQQQQQQQSVSGSASPAFVGVRVELQQLVLAILDDPIVSRVFGEAGFRSCDIKLAVLRPQPSVLRFPRSARCPPLFLCNFSGFQLPAHLAADGGDENCRRIAEVIAMSRNPILVGVGAAEAAWDFGRMVERQDWAGMPQEIRGSKFVNIEKELSSGDKEAVCARMEEIGREEDDRTGGVLVSVGDLNGLVGSSEDAADCLLSELTKVLECRRLSLWVMGWSATYEIYLKFLSRYPMVDKDWNLQLLPMTSHRTGMGGLHPKSPSLMDSFVPFGGLFSQAYESVGTLNNPYQSMPRCQHCNEQYEKEIAAVLKGNSTSPEDSQKVVLPSWLQKADVGIKDGFDFPKIKDDRNVFNAKMADLQKKWNEYCQCAHRASHIQETKNYQVTPHLVGIPYISETSSLTERITNPLLPQGQNIIGNAFNVSGASVPNAASASQSISFPEATEPSHGNSAPNLYNKFSKSEPVFVRGSQSRQATLSDLGILDGHTSPSSVTSVVTELALGAANNHASLEGKSALEASSHSSTSRNINEPRQSVSKVHFHASYPPLDSSVKGSYIHGKTWPDLSHIEQKGKSSPTILQKFDVSNCKELYSSLVAKVGRQEEALWAISEAVIQCKTRSEKCHGPSPSPRGAIWLSFLGPDKAGKKMTALALAELIFGCSEDLICIDLSFEYDDDGSITNQKALLKCNTGFRGKTIIDHIAWEISKKPLSVFLLENVDKTDLLAQSSLSNAIRSGKFPDSHGREVSICNSIFVTTVKDHPGKTLSPEKNNVNFSEERILAARRWQMKILVRPFSVSEASLCNPSSQVSVISRQESFISKRKPGKRECQDEYSASLKRPHKSSGIDLDLNLSAEEQLRNGDGNGSSEDNSMSEDSQEWLEEFLNLMDKALPFKPFDFDSLADYVLREIRRGFCNNNVGSNTMLEIEAKVMEQILAAAWFMKSKGELGGWIEEVLCRSLGELRLRHKLSDCNVVRLAAVQDLLVEESELGMFLPSKIILE